MSPAVQLDGAVSLDDVRRRLDEDIAALEAALRDGVPPHGPAWGPGAGSVRPHAPSEIEKELRFLRQLAAGLDRLPDTGISRERAGYGSQVYVRDVPSQRERVHKLIVGEPDPRDAGQLPLDSPIGAALLGAKRGDVAVATVPGRVVRTRVFHMRTLPQRLGL